MLYKIRLAFDCVNKAMDRAVAGCDVLI